MVASWLESGPRASQPRARPMADELNARRFEGASQIVDGVSWQRGRSRLKIDDRSLAELNHDSQRRLRQTNELAGRLKLCAGDGHFPFLNFVALGDESHPERFESVLSLSSMARRVLRSSDRKALSQVDAI